MKSSLLFIAILWSTLCSAQTLMKKELDEILRTTLDSTRAGMHFNWPIWLCENEDSSYYKSDTIVFYGNPDFKLCEDSLDFCKTLEWTFYLFTGDYRSVVEYQNLSPPSINRSSTSPDPVALLSPGKSIRRDLKFRMYEHDEKLIISIQSEDLKMELFELLEVKSWPSKDDPLLSVSRIKLFRLKKKANSRAHD